MAKRTSMRSKMRGKLKKKTEASHKNRDQGGGLANYFDKEKMEKVNTWWANKGDHIIDVIPYLAGTHDPNNKPDEPVYVLDLKVHRGVGAMEEIMVCPEQYGDPCPICEEMRKRSHQDLDFKTEIKPLKPGRRVMYNIVVRDGGDMEKKGVQVFEIAHWFMEKHLAKIAKDPRGGGFTIFSDPDDGKSISFERSGVGATSTNYEGHRFLDRTEVITDEELEGAFCLDDLIELKSYDEIYKAFHGEAPESDDDDTADDTADDDVDNDDVDDDVDDVDDDDAVEEKPAEKPKRGGKKRRAKKGPSCPHGHTIGDDIDEYEECDDCEMWDACDELADQ